jgi:hypothetical protein
LLPPRYVYTATRRVHYRRLVYSNNLRRERGVRDRQGRVREGQGDRVGGLRRRQALVQALLQGGQDHQEHRGAAAAAAVQTEM